MNRRHFLAVLASACALPARAQPQRLRTLLESGQTSAMMVLRGGKSLFEYGDLVRISYVASARKSLVSMLYGPAVASGKIRLDRTLAQMDFDDMDGLLPREREASIRDLLMARSGIYHKAANSGDASDRAPPRGSVQPGSYFLYNNWDFNALGTIYERQTGRDFYRAFAEDIAEPIGLRDYRIVDQAIRNDTHLSDHPARHFVLSTRDMAALGQLMLQKRPVGEAPGHSRRLGGALHGALNIRRRSHAYLAIRRRPGLWLAMVGVRSGGALARCFERRLYRQRRVRPVHHGSAKTGHGGSAQSGSAVQAQCPAGGLSSQDPASRSDRGIAALQASFLRMAGAGPIPLSWPLPPAIPLPARSGLS